MNYDYKITMSMTISHDTYSHTHSYFIVIVHFKYFPLLLIIIYIVNYLLVIVCNIINVYLYSVNMATVLAEILPRNI